MYTLAHIQQLEFGYSFHPDGFTGGRSFEGSSLRPDGPGWFEACGAWQFLHPQILRDWIQKPCRPTGRGGAGTRPWAWWSIDKRERRRRIDGKPHPFDNPERKALVEQREAAFPGQRYQLTKLFYGVPGSYCIHDDFEAVYESEAEYIERLNLWLPGEIAAGIPVLTAEIAEAKRADDPRLNDVLRRAEAMLGRLTKKAATG